MMDIILNEKELEKYWKEISIKDKLIEKICNIINYDDIAEDEKIHAITNSLNQYFNEISPKQKCHGCNQEVKKTRHIGPMSLCDKCIEIYEQVKSDTE